MINCREFERDDVVAITAIPIENIPAADVESFVNQLTPVIIQSGDGPSMDGSVTIGLQPAVSGGTVIPIIRDSGKVKDDESDGVSGRLHTTTVSCEVDDRNWQTWNHLLALERMNSHLLLTFRGGTRAFVAATEDTYFCHVQRDDAKTSVTFRIQSIMGLQLVYVDSEP